jgi:magnesium and cobalt transporter
LTLRILATWGLAFIVDLWIARPIGHAFAEPLIYRGWPVLRWLGPTVGWIAVVSLAVRSMLFRIQGLPPGGPTIEDEIRTVVNEGEREGSIRQDAAEMIEGLMHLPNVTAGKVMTPRTRLTMLPATTTVAEAAACIYESGHSRIPVFGETRDEIVGVLIAKDLMPTLLDPKQFHRALAPSSLRKPLYVPENRPVDELLADFKRRRLHVAMVTDEHGGCAGMVTIEDILEEIVGEIEDEYDDDSDRLNQIKHLDDRRIEIDARLPVVTFNEVAPKQIDESERYDTVGGYLMDDTGRVPQKDERVEIDGVRFTVVDGTDRKLNRLLVEFPEPNVEESADSPGRGNDVE